MYLLDTNVISELRRPRPHGAVLAWLAAVRPATLCLSAITLGEIQSGIERIRPNDPVKAQEIEAWADAALHAFEILSIDAPIMRQWARLTRGKPDPHYEDSILAVTAMHLRLVLVTRHVRDFKSFDVRIINPFQFSSGE